MPEPTNILYCRCSFADALPKAVKDEVLRGLVGRGVQFQAVTDLCALSAAKDPRLARMFGEGRGVIIACHERAVRWLLEYAGVSCGDGIKLLNMRARPAAEILQGVENSPAQTPSADPEGDFQTLRKSLAKEANAAAWIPWFPVLDMDKCNHCKQCMAFCLFGVYGQSAEGKVQVQNPANCKTHCPACARVCPQAAILFPKHGTGPVNGGPAEEGGEPTKVDLSGLSKMDSKDLYAALRERSRQAGRQTKPPEEPHGPR